MLTSTTLLMQKHRCHRVLGTGESVSWEPVTAEVREKELVRKDLKERHTPSVMTRDYDKQPLSPRGAHPASAHQGDG